MTEKYLQERDSDEYLATIFSIKPSNVQGGRKAIRAYQQVWRDRERQYGQPKITNSCVPDIVEKVKNQGYAKIENAFNKEHIEKLKTATDKLLNKNRHLKLRNKHFALIDQPLLNADQTVPLAFSDLLIEIGSQFFQCMPAIGTVNLRKSYINDLPEERTLLFHCDENSINLLKFFFYLNDVDIEGGPFVYVKHSHNDKFTGWNKKYRWSHKEIAKEYGKRKIKYLTANVGDLVIANTTGFHRGCKPIKKNRMMYTVNYVIHPEYNGKPEQISKKAFESLPERKRPLADFLIPT